MLGTGAQCGQAGRAALLWARSDAAKQGGCTTAGTHRAERVQLPHSSECDMVCVAISWPSSYACCTTPQSPVSLPCRQQQVNHVMGICRQQAGG